MKRVVIDASALGALTFQEPEGETIRRQLKDAVVFAPTILKFELANIAWKKIRRAPAHGGEVLSRLEIALDDRWGPVWQDVQATDVALVAVATGLTAYDASYLWLAGSLGAELITLDRMVAAASQEI